jgi:hypothetical protein
MTLRSFSGVRRVPRGCYRRLLAVPAIDPVRVIANRAAIANEMTKMIMTAPLVLAPTRVSPASTTDQKHD